MLPGYDYLTAHFVDEAKTGKLKPAKNKVVAEPFKKFLLDIFMLLIPPVN